MAIPASLIVNVFFHFAPLDLDWDAVPQAAFFGWLAFYVVLLGNAVFGGKLFQWFDLVFVPIHEGGHLLFGYFGKWIMVAGGTFLQLFVPFALAVYFMFKRQVPGAAFCAFFFFEQFLPVGTYMADALCKFLEYVTVGDLRWRSTIGFIFFRTRESSSTPYKSAPHSGYWAGSECSQRWVGLCGAPGRASEATDGH